MVIVKDHHDGKAPVLIFTLSNGETISVTGNHGMLVYNDGDPKGPTKRSQLTYAHDVKVGMKFRTLGREMP